MLYYKVRYKAFTWKILSHQLKSHLEQDEILPIAGRARFSYEHKLYFICGNKGLADQFPGYLNHSLSSGGARSRNLGGHLGGKLIFGGGKIEFLKRYCYTATGGRIS